MPAISIIMPVYNKENYIDKSIQSILNQTFQDYELIIINDGSTDNSLETIKKHINMNDKIKLISIENGGVSKARNVGLIHAQGKYITFIDADDYVDSMFLENLYTCIVQNNVQMVISGLIKKWDDLEEPVIPPYQGIHPMVRLIQNFVSIQNDTGIYAYCVAKLLDRELLKDTFFNESIKLAEDFDFYLNIYDKIDKIYFDNHCYYSYIQDTSFSSFQVKDSQIDYMTQLMIQIKFKKFLEKKNTFRDENEILLLNKIESYIHAILIYTPLNKVRKQTKKLAKILQDNNINFEKVKKRKSVLTFLFSKRKYLLVWVYIFLFQIKHYLHWHERI